jgi:hypothetical protein
MLPIPNRYGFASFAPELGFPLMLAKLEPRMAFRISDPRARFPESQLCQHMTMLAGNRQANDLRAELFQLFTDREANDGAKLDWDHYRSLFQGRSTAIALTLIGAGTRRIFVVALDVFAMVSSSETASVSI